MKIRYVLALALLVVIASCSKKTAPAAATKQLDPVALFGKNCSGCHGSDGTNGRSPNLSKTTLDLNGLNQIIAKGHGHMPAFEDNLSAPEITAISKWVLSIKKD